MQWNCAQPPNQIAGGETDDFAIGELPAKNFHHGAIGRVFELRHNDGSVGDVEVAIAGRQSLAVVKNRPRHRQRDDFQRLAVLIGHVLEPFNVPTQRSVIEIVGILFPSRHHGARTDETSQLVDVPVGVVSFDTFAKPQDFLRAR